MSHLKILDILADKCLTHCDATQRDPMARYMKDQFVFYGIKSPARKAIVKEIWNDHKDVIRQEIRPLVNALWAVEERENQYIAMELIHKGFL